MAGTKELQELIAGVKEVALVAKAVLKDGKVDLTDLAHLSTLLSKQAALLAAFEGVANIPGEVKDLSLDEAMAVITDLVNAAKEVKAA